MARTETVTVVFTDLVGSTELASRLGHDAYEALRHAHFTALRAAVAKHSGTRGEDHRRRLDAALRQRRRRHRLRRRHAAGDRWRTTRRDRTTAIRVQIRIGISVGRGDARETATSSARRWSKRRGCAPPRPAGQIVVSDVVRVLARGTRPHVHLGRRADAEGAARAGRRL